MPDGTNAESTTTDDQEPGTPEDQVNAEITREHVFGWWRSLFGMGDPYEAGGGGTGGQFMFASVEELNGVIKKWEDEREAIAEDRDQISDAYWSIKEPAADTLSREITTASKDSLANLWNHSNAMWDYADNYILKLKASRDQMSVMEEGAEANVRSVRRDLQA